MNRNNMIIYENPIDDIQNHPSESHVVMGVWGFP